MYSYHSYQQYDKRSLRLVIRNRHPVHPSTSNKDIITSLSDLGHHINHVLNIKRFSNKLPLPLFFIDSIKATYNSDLYKIDYLVLNKKYIYYRSNL